MEKGSIFWAAPHRWHYSVQVVLLCVHQLRHNLPLVSPGVVLVCVHRCLLLCSLLSWIFKSKGVIACDACGHGLMLSLTGPFCLKLFTKKSLIFVVWMLWKFGFQNVPLPLTTVSRPHGLILVKVVVLKLVEVCLRHAVCSWDLKISHVRKWPREREISEIYNKI